MKINRHCFSGIVLLAALADSTCTCQPMETASDRHAVWSPDAIGDDAGSAFQNPVCRGGSSTGKTSVALGRSGGEYADSGQETDLHRLLGPLANLQCGDVLPLCARKSRDRRSLTI